MEGNPFTEVVDHSFCEQSYPDPSIQPAGTCKRDGSLADLIQQENGWKLIVALLCLIH